MKPESKTTLDRQIALALCRVIRKLTDDIEILSVIGSYRDSLTDEEVLGLLYAWLEDGKVLHAKN